MAYDEQLAARVREILVGRNGSSERKMFGGLCFMLNRNMVCGVVNNDFMVRVGPDNYKEALTRPHTRVMDFTGRPMTGYVFVDGDGVERKESLTQWVELGVSYVEGLPPKKPKKHPPKRL